MIVDIHPGRVWLDYFFLQNIKQTKMEKDAIMQFLRFG